MQAFECYDYQLAFVTVMLDFKVIILFKVK